MPFRFHTFFLTPEEGTMIAFGIAAIIGILGYLIYLLLFKDYEHMIGDR